MTRNRKKAAVDKPAQDSPEEESSARKSIAPGIAAPEASFEAAPPLQAEPQERTVRCVICSTATQAGSPDHMCWVCRRLKISAWREAEQQMPAQD